MPFKTLLAINAYLSTKIVKSIYKPNILYILQIVCISKILWLSFTYKTVIDIKDHLSISKK